MSKSPVSLSRRQLLLSGAAVGGLWLLPGLRNAVWAAGSDAPEKPTVRVRLYSTDRLRAGGYGLGKGV
ncbi:hypothetical protein WDV93_14490 [Pantoea ananatis]